MLIRRLLPLILSTSLTSAQDSWLEFNAGASDNSSPLVHFNGRWDEFLTFDVELRGILAETVTVGSQDYLRFSTSPGTVPSDSIGFPELPVVRRMVWLPDDSDITLDYSASCCQGMECLPVYPAPLDSLVSDSTCTPYIGEYFRLDSSAYASTDWYPGDQARLVGEFRLRDLRVGIVDVYPVQYLASEDSLRAWSDIEVMLSWDEGNAVWSEAGLGHFDNLIGDDLLGYTPEPQPINDGTGSVVRVYANRLVAGPGYAPDYVILVAAGLDGQAVTDLANHRDDLNGFDVAIVRTDDVLTCYGGTQTILTADMIREFTEDMWEWGSGPGDRPTYLLLIGDHEDPAYASETWFLPTRTGVGTFGNDSWFVGLGEPRSDLMPFPDMIVGRLPARTSTNLRDMVTLIGEFEAPVSAWPPPQSLSWRRWLSRLTGAGMSSNPPEPYDPYQPDVGWLQRFAGWLGYSWDNWYCGDGNRANTADGSEMTSAEWVDHCRDVFSRGSQIVFYIDHGSTHLFSAGLEWWHGAPPHLGIPDSCFDDIDVEALPFTIQHGWPFVLMLCCSSGDFCHTQAVHQSTWTLCFSDQTPPFYDFGTDCFAEEFIQNTEGGAIGVFAPTTVTTSKWQYYALGITSAVMENGLTRTGDAIQACRLAMLDHLFFSGGYDAEPYNLLGDPAVDIGDRVKFRNRCDLLISPEDLAQNRYLTRSVGQTTGTAGLTAVVRNTGAVASGSFRVSMTVSCGSYSTDLTEDCGSIEPGGERVVRFDWEVPTTLVPPLVLTLHAVADPQGTCLDSWTANNDASVDLQVLDFYPNDGSWPARTMGSVESPPALGDLDGDESLEIVIIDGATRISAYDPGDPAEPIWTNHEAEFILPSSSYDGYTVPLIADVSGSSLPEVVCDSYDRLVVLDGADGSELCSFAHDDPGDMWCQGVTTPVVGDLWPGGGNEIALICRDYSGSHSYLAVLRAGQGAMTHLGSWDLPSSAPFHRAWLCAGQLTVDGTREIVVSHSRRSGIQRYMGIWLWDYDEVARQATFTGQEWLEGSTQAAERFGIPALGNLGSQGMRIALSREDSDPEEHSPLIPAWLLDPADLQTPLNCQPTSTPSDNILCCMMADWDPLTTGLDRVIAPAENQAFVWESDGRVNWYTEFGSFGDPRPPFGALGNLDNLGAADLLVGTRTGMVQAFGSNGVPLTPLGFPYTLPSEVCGGYCIADIDLDGKVEVVFGTMDNYLHVWELGECDEGYTPWPQVQHDAARTGVLE